MAPLYILLLISSLAYASSNESLTGNRLSDVNETSSIASRNDAAEANGGKNEISGSHTLELANGLPKSRRFNVAHIRSSVRSNADPSGVNSELHIHKVSRGDGDSVLTETGDQHGLLTHTHHSHRRSKSPYSPVDLSRTADPESADANGRRAERQQQNEYLSPFYRSLSNLANLWSRSAQDAKENLSAEATSKEGQTNTVESVNEANVHEVDAKPSLKELSEANARLSDLLRVATDNIASSKENRRLYSRRSDSAVKVNESKPKRRSFDANAYYYQLLQEAINQLGSITEPNTLGFRSATPSVDALDDNAKRHLKPISEVTARLSHQQQEIDNLGSAGDGKKLSLLDKSRNSGLDAYERALNEAIKKISSINDANRMAWDRLSRNGNLDSDLQSDVVDTHPLLAKKNLLESSNVSSRSCTDDKGKKEAEDDVIKGSRAGWPGLGHLRKRSVESLSDSN